MKTICLLKYIYFSRYSITSFVAIVKGIFLKLHFLFASGNIGDFCILTSENLLNLY